MTVHSEAHREPDGSHSGRGVVCRSQRAVSNGRSYLFLPQLKPLKPKEALMPHPGKEVCFSPSGTLNTLGQSESEKRLQNSLRETELLAGGNPYVTLPSGLLDGALGLLSSGAKTC